MITPTQHPRWNRRVLRRLGQFIRYSVLVILLLNVSTETVRPHAVFDLRLGSLTVGQRFDWWGWNTEAVIEEVSRWFAAQPLSTEAADKAEILAFVARQREIAGLEQQIRIAYAALDNVDSMKPSSLLGLEADLETLYQTQQAATPQAERILSAQVTQVLVEQGFAQDGRLWPPVAFRFNDLPTYLIISQRDEISQYRGVYLLPDMLEGERATLEAQVEASLDVSALVDNVGGIGSWPTMVSDPVSLRSMLDIIAHEWNHNDMAFHPLGLNYNTSRDMTTINETVASIFAEEMVDLILARYYPELLPPPKPPEPSPATANTTTKVEPTPAEESFSDSMRRIRLSVDDLLAAGQVEEAEAYMESERQELVKRGHHLRKLNQAYFAFHGSYAISPGAVDPIGPWLRELRAYHKTLNGFIDQVAQMQRLDDLLVALDQTRR